MDGATPAATVTERLSDLAQLLRELYAPSVAILDAVLAADGAEPVMDSTTDRRTRAPRRQDAQEREDDMRTYASVYDYETGNELTTGLQGCTVCDEAILTAESIADDRGKPVELVDDDGRWLVHPTVDGHRESADFLGDDDEEES